MIAGTLNRILSVAKHSVAEPCFYHRPTCFPGKGNVAPAGDCPFVQARQSQGKLQFPFGKLLNGGAGVGESRKVACGELDGVANRKLRDLRWSKNHRARNVRLKLANNRAEIFFFLVNGPIGKQGGCGCCPLGRWKETEGGKPAAACGVAEATPVIAGVGESQGVLKVPQNQRWRGWWLEVGPCAGWRFGVSGGEQPAAAKKNAECQKRQAIGPEGESAWHTLGVVATPSSVLRSRGLRCCCSRSAPKNQADRSQENQGCGSILPLSTRTVLG